MFEPDFRRHRAVQPGCHVMFGYGSSETMVGGCLDIRIDAPTPPHFDRSTAFPGVAVAIEDALGMPIAGNDAAGDLIVQNAWLATGDLGDPERSAATFVERDGVMWCRTGTAPDGAAMDDLHTDHSERERFLAIGTRRYKEQLLDANTRPWRPVQCPGRLVIVDHSARASADAWRTIFPGGLSEVTVPGGHTSILAEPHVAEVAEAVIDAIRAWRL